MQNKAWTFSAIDNNTGLLEHVVEILGVEHCFQNSFKSAERSYLYSRNAILVDPKNSDHYHQPPDCLTA